MIEQELLKEIVSIIVEGFRRLDEYVVPMGFSLEAWKSFRKKNKVSNKDYHKEYPDKKWKVVHGHKRGQVGKALPGLNDVSYEKASKAHRGIVMGKDG